MVSPDTKSIDKDNHRSDHGLHKRDNKKDHKSKTKRPYEEIGASFNGNEIKIRVPKSTYKPPKLTPSQQKLQQTCTCDDDESVCSEDCGAPTDGYGPQNKLNFQARTDGFHAIMRKRCASMLERVRASSNTILSTVAARWDSPWLARWIRLHAPCSPK